MCAAVKRYIVIPETHSHIHPYLQPELILHLLHGLIWLHLNVRNIRFDHERKQVENQLGFPSQHHKCCVAHGLEPLEMNRLIAACVQHVCV